MTDAYLNRVTLSLKSHDTGVTNPSHANGNCFCRSIRSARTEKDSDAACLSGRANRSPDNELGQSRLSVSALPDVPACGFGLIDIAKIAYMTRLTFWLGNAVALGIRLIYAPEIASTINQLPAAANRELAVAALAAIAGYLMWLSPCPRVIGRDGWQVTLPDVWLGLWPETCRRLHAVLAKRRDRGGDWAELRVHGRRAEIDPRSAPPMRSGAASGSPEPPWSASSPSANRERPCVFSA